MTPTTRHPLPAHGGNLAEIARAYGVDEASLIDFSANINPLGQPEPVRSVIENGADLLLHYPDPDSTELANALAERHGCDPANIVVGNGSNELVYLLARAVSPRRAAILEPTFSEYGRALGQVRCDVCRLFAEEDDGFSHPFTQLQQASARFDATFLCNPNNPTGALAGRDQIMHIARTRPERVVAVDEAFMDFVEDSAAATCADVAAQTENLIVFRSMTKFYAIPGLRLGYAVGPKHWMDKLRELREPWSVNALAQKAGLAAVADAAFARRTLDFLGAERPRLKAGIEEVEHLQPFASPANFLMVKITTPKFTCDQLRAALIPKRLVIRHCSNFPGLGPPYFRLAVRNADENQTLLAALREVMQKSTS